jgi:hypothetical protein
MFRFPKRAVEIFAFAMRAPLFTTAEGKWQTKPQGKKTSIQKRSNKPNNTTHTPPQRFP